jgi:palmitoyltransferase
LFLVFLWLELYALLTSVGVGISQLRGAVLAGVWNERLAWITFFLILGAFVSISVGVLAVAQASQVARNVTTNELANWHRYSYLQDSMGGFSNPFNRGFKANCFEAFNPDATPVAPMMLGRDGPGGEVSTRFGAMGAGAYWMNGVGGEEEGSPSAAAAAVGMGSSSETGGGGSHHHQCRNGECRH